MRSLCEIANALQQAVAELEPATLSGEDATRVLRELTRIERIAAAGGTAVASRVAESNAWRGSGDRSAADFLARQTGESVGRSRAVLETAEKLQAAPAVAQAFASGELSPAQAAVVADAAAVAGPEAERLLLAAAPGMPLAKLKDAAARVRQAGEDAEARHERVRQSRFLRTWTDADGATCGQWKLTVDAGAVVLAALQPFIEGAYRQQRAAGGQRESSEAVAADGLTAMCAAVKNGDVQAPAKARWKGETILLVNAESLRRGSVSEGETCEIAGVGTVPVSVARELLGDALLKVVVRDGTDIRTVVHTKRRATAEMLTALLVRDGGSLRCIRPGCARAVVHVEHREDWAHTHQTRLDALAGICWHDHDLKTHHGHTYRHGDRGWQWHHPDGRVEYERPPPEGGRG